MLLIRNAHLFISRKLIIALNRELPEIIDNTIRNINHSKENDEIKHYCRKIGIKLLRAAFHLTIEKEGFWTDDIRRCYLTVKKCFPESYTMFKELYNWTKKPIIDKSNIFKMIDLFTKWYTIIYKNIIAE